MDNQQLQSEPVSIRNLMERSAKFISLSGVSGSLAGTYALIGGAMAYRGVYGFSSKFRYRDDYVTDRPVLLKLVIIATTVLLLSLATAIWLSLRKTCRRRRSIWKPASKGLLKAMRISLVAGGIFILFSIARGLYGNETCDFNSLKELLKVTDGNLASHLKALEKVQYVEMNKSFVGRKTNTSYRAFDTRKRAFTKHRETLKQLIKQQKQ